MHRITNHSFESEGFRAHLFLSKKKRSRRTRWAYIASSKLTTVLAEESQTWRSVKATHAPRQHVVPKQLAFEFSFEQMFRSLVRQWRDDTEHMSNVNKANAHPAYQQIIGMGRVLTSQIVPLLLKELEERPDHWFRALVEITGTDPAEGQDTFEGAISSWLDWGKRKGYSPHARSAA